MFLLPEFQREKHALYESRKKTTRTRLFRDYSLRCQCLFVICQKKCTKNPNSKPNKRLNRTSKNLDDDCNFHHFNWSGFIYVTRISFCNVRSLELLHQTWAVQKIVTVISPWLTRPTEAHEILLEGSKEDDQEDLWKAVARA